MKTYTNPVWPGYFADPFVLRVGDDYWAYGTGPAVDGREFPVLHSRDLVAWESKGAALVPLPGLRPGAFWAPEVVEKDGTFYLYYSGSTSDSDADQRLRVATAKNPAGPFIDSGKMILPDAGFTIDADPFRDPQTGKWYLYFAADYVAQEPMGTGLAVVPLADDLMTATAPPTMVLRASTDWQIYERNRDYKGKKWPKWFCVEGPSVIYHDGKYYCFYSGGAWHSENYGLGFAVADHPLGPWKDDFAIRGPTVLTGIPAKVIGPGHNSIVLGPDNQTQFVVYHAWDTARVARRLCIDPLMWTKEGPKCDGPSFEPREITVVK